MPFTPQEFKITPIMAYNGLTVILSNPSRFDIKASNETGKPRMLTGAAGRWFLGIALKEAGINPASCEFRLADDESPLRPGTKLMLCLGQQAQTRYLLTSTTLGEQRGSPVEMTNGMIGISSYPPQECFDQKNYERAFRDNALEEDYVSIFDEDSELTGDDEMEGDFKDDVTSRHGRTSRANFKAWLEADLRKVFFLLKNNIPRDNTEVIIVDDVAQKLREHTGTFYFDIETAPDLSIRCFAWCSDEGPVYVAEMMNERDEVRKDFFTVLLELTRVIRRSLVVIHNGTCFDLPVLIWRYGLPAKPKKLYDTMLAQHRCYPLLEKSLGHAGSLWTFERYHKNDGIYNPSTPTQQHQLLHYCGVDVALMRLVHRKQLQYATHKKGLMDSINHVNRAAVPYMIASLYGCLIDEQRRESVSRRHDLKATLFNKVAVALLGPQLEASLKLKGKLFLSSPAKLVSYFHDIQGYAPVGFTGKNNPKLGETELYKLALVIGNHPILKLALAYRENAKAASDLKLTPYYRNFYEWSKAQRTLVLDGASC